MYLGGFVHKELHAKILRSAKQAGMEHNKFGFVTELLQEGLALRKARRRRKPSPPKR
jgi:hypothetical protein